MLVLGYTQGRKRLVLYSQNNSHQNFLLRSTADVDHYEKGFPYEVMWFGSFRPKRSNLRKDWCTRISEGWQKYKFQWYPFTNTAAIDEVGARCITSLNEDGFNLIKFTINIKLKKELSKDKSDKTHSDRDIYNHPKNTRETTKKVDTLD